jgi:hypothetical protein
MHADDVIVRAPTDAEHEYRTSVRKYSESQPRVPAGTSEGGEFASADGVPPEPGTLPLAPGEIRGYHYTNSAEALHSILKEGLSLGHARGNTYGEPDMLWFSAAKPNPDNHAFIEVHLKPEELNVGGPWAGEHWDQQEIDRFMKAGSNFTLLSDKLSPDRIATYSEPWHDHYRYMMSEYPPEQATDETIAEMKDVAKYDPDYGKAVDLWLSKVPQTKAEALKFNPDQPRDDRGRWTSDGASILDTHKAAWDAVGKNLDSMKNPTTGERGMGNCYPAAYRLASLATELGLTNVKVCHGTARPRSGQLRGVSYGHAWVEADPPSKAPIRGMNDWLRSQGAQGADASSLMRTAYDWSSHNRVAMDAAVYRALGGLHDITEYTPEETILNAVRSGHYGPWE